MRTIQMNSLLLIIMISHVLILLYLTLVKLQWVLVHEAFYSKTETSTGGGGGSKIAGWEFSCSCSGGGGGGGCCSGGGGVQTHTCQSNGIMLMKIDECRKRIRQTLSNSLPHFQIEISFDSYFNSEPSNSHSLQLYAESSQIFSQTYQTLSNYKPICYTSGANEFHLKSYNVTATHNSDYDIDLKFCTTLDQSGKWIGLRNIQVYIKTCHYTCKRCSSDSFCTSCVKGSPSGGVCPTCKTDTTDRFYDLTSSTDCISECSTSNRLADQNNVCQVDARVSNLVSLLTNSNSFLTDMNVIEDSYPRISLYQQPYVDGPSCGSYYFGGFKFNQGISKSLSAGQNAYRLRVRFTLQLESWTDGCVLWFYLDGVIFAKIEQIAGALQTTNLEVISLQSCGSRISNRYEAVFEKVSDAPILKLLGNMDVDVQSAWYVRSLQVSKIVCATNCDICLDQDNCATCSSGNSLHQGKCLSVCPTHSTLQTIGGNQVCVDYGDQIINSGYLVKAFYDSVTRYDITEIAGTVTATQNTFTGSWQGYIEYKKVLGGVLNWYSASFQKNHIITRGHYAYTLRMNLVIGDSQTAGSFTYTISGLAAQSISYNTNLAGRSEANIWGTFDNDRIFPIYQYVSFSTSPLSVQLNCQLGGSAFNGFCAIYDYFIIVHYCAPDCNACSGPQIADCTAPANYAATHSNSCSGNTYFDISTWTCLSCPANCLTCSDSSTCLSCNTSAYFELIYKSCLCEGGRYWDGVSCTKCDKKCNTCTAGGSSSCTSCIALQQRFLNKNQCVCSFGYIETGGDACQPICGDKYVAVGEECDDGNDMQFDGCHQCKFQCDEKCAVCVQGVCQICVSGYYINVKLQKCLPLCNDGILSGQEACDDQNSRLFDTCWNCKQDCQPSCSTCYYGVCQSCLSGYLLSALGLCEPYCGDKLVVHDEQCDDGNDNPFDGCFVCRHNCQQECLVCTLGRCQLCVSGYVVDLLSDLCVPNCGDGLILPIEICDDGNFSPYDGCFRCSFQCQLECINCLQGVCLLCQQGYHLFERRCVPTCGDGVVLNNFEFCDDGNNIQFDGCFQCSYSCSPECKSCWNGLCTDCLNFWRVDEEFKCSPNCGDQTPVGYEECDDGNLIGFDGCFGCFNQCQLSCKFCIQGQCQECHLGFALGQNHLCSEICGDVMLVGYEQCDDGNQVYFDGCHDCKISCQESCTSCTKEGCFSCSIGWYLNDWNHTCEPKCGDGILVYSSEQCDDGNFLDFDGCSSCNYQCQPVCSNCYFGVCQLCIYGYYLSTDQQCYPKCGDYIKAKDEECDERDDRCILCQHVCQQPGCVSCVYGTCYECDQTQGWYLNPERGVCETRCLDSIRASTERCEPLQNIIGSGCFDCEFSCDSYCQTCSYGYCQSCIKGYYFHFEMNLCLPSCGDLIKSFDEQCDELSSLTLQKGCHHCSYQCELSCQTCSPQGKCLECKSGLELQQGICIPLCGDLQIVEKEQCDDANSVSYDGCFGCKFNCHQYCAICLFGECSSCLPGYYLDDLRKCEPTCGDLIQVKEEYCDNSMPQVEAFCLSCQAVCPLGCLQCTQHKCIECIFGWAMTTEGFCQEECGNKIVTINEVCDDGNDKQYDGCFQCFWQCQLECETCIEGICAQCKQGYGFDLYGICVSICGDLIVTGNENCDDGNFDIHDGCHFCLFSCGPHCSHCVDGICHYCEAPFEHSGVQPACNPLCGDHLAVYEECDDGNSLDKDGCFQCRFDCPYNCLVCSFGTCALCDFGYYLDTLMNTCQAQCGDMIASHQEECEDLEQGLNDGCFQCKFTCPENCAFCNNGLCVLCKHGYQANTQGLCQSYCGDKIVTGTEQCDDGNEVRYDGCYLCQRDFQLECASNNGIDCLDCVVGFEYQVTDGYCYPICGDGLRRGDELCDDGNLDMYDGCFDCFPSCQKECLKCHVDGICLECDESVGWYKDVFGGCEPHCGDQIVAGIEECDDGNPMPYDGCSPECIMDCQKACTVCIQIYCYECNTPGWSWRPDLRCYPVCGDGLVLGGEICDDGNDEPYDGCYECDYQCEQVCTKCQKGFCRSCEQGWTLVKGKCQPVCGDLILIQGLEECDDGNSIPYDGCYNCSYNCVEFCVECREGICFECDSFGWKLDTNDNKCYPVCGDGQKLGAEKCDDGNDVPKDGCYECEFQCHDACLDCVDGVCAQCDLGWFQDGTQCNHLCGDGFLSTFKEECDDGNLSSMDGCNELCIMEPEWQCLNNFGDISECANLREPEIILYSSSLRNENPQSVSLQFTQKMKLVYPELEPSEILTASILDITKDAYSISIESVGEDVKNVAFRIQVRFNITVLRPKFRIEIKEHSLVSQYKSSLLEYVAYLRLQTVEVLSNEETQAVEAAKVYSEKIVYVLVAISMLSLITGSMDIFWNLLDQLQLLSYIKYVNIDFPLNLDTFFELFKIVSISPLLDLLGFNDFIRQLNGGEIPYQRPAQKFAQDSYNCYFLTNFSSSLLCFIFGYANYLFCLTISTLLYEIRPYQVQRIPRRILQRFFSFRKALSKSAKEYCYSGILRLIMANYYDVMFSTTIQLTHLEWDTPQKTINSLLALGVLALQVFVILKMLVTMSRLKSKCSFSSYTKEYEILFDGIHRQTNQKFWTLQYNAMILIKKFLYISVIVLLYQNGTIQTLLIALTSTLYTAYTIMVSPQAEAGERIKQVVTEALTTLNTMTFLLYLYRFELKLSQQDIMMVGWVHILNFTIILVTSLIIDTYAQFQRIYKQFIKPRLSSFRKRSSSYDEMVLY